jgi:hypothetical protein
MARWVEINGEAVFATRPWLTFGEGPSTEAGHQPHSVTHTARDVRYTRSWDGRIVYALPVGWPDEALTLQSTLVRAARADASVRLLGHATSIPFEINDRRQLVLRVPALAPAQRRGDAAFAFRLAGFDLDAQEEAKISGSNRTVALALDKATHDTQQWNSGRVSGLPALVAWGDRVGSVQWLARFPAAGRYRLAARVHAPDGASRIVFEVAGTPVALELADTPEFKKPLPVQGGTADIASAGVHRIVMRAGDPASYRRVHVFRVYLVPE